MIDDPRTEPLRRWNALARTNTENAIVSAMFDAVLKSSETINEYGTWLLVGAASIAAFYISNGDDVVELLTRRGFLVCGGFLVFSCLCGLSSKFLALLNKINSDVRAALLATMIEHLQKYDAEEKAIQEGAEFWGIALETGVRMERILDEYLAPFPKFFARLVKKRTMQNMANPQAHYYMPARLFLLQSILVGIQSMTFLGFLIAGLYYVAFR